MPRAEVGTQKWLANKMKAKGLQKLRWYCQMCEKQCRDENGFKCHRMSEGHQRQMQIFVQKPGRFMDQFSREFEASFMRLMRTRYCRTRILANTVYQDLISDRNHVHMNGTIWVTLSEFVLYLSRTNKCTAEHTPKGWYIRYIDQEKLKREEREESKRKAEISLEAQQLKRIQTAVDAAQSQGKYQKPSFTPLNKTEETKVSISIGSIKNKTSENINDALTSKENILLKQYKLHRKSGTLKDDTTPFKQEKQPAFSSKISALDRLMSEAQQTSVKRRSNSTGDTEESKKKLKKAEPWIKKGLVVRIVGQRYENTLLYRLKGRIISCIDDHRAVIEIPDIEQATVDEQDLETVIPNLGTEVYILRGTYRGAVGTLKAICCETFSGSVMIKASELKRLKIDGNTSNDAMLDLAYEDFCKYRTL